MSFKDEYDFDLVVNDVKKLVIDEIDSQLNTISNREICRCQDCVLDMTALALNHLKPSYRSTLSFKGVMYRQKLHTDKHRDAVQKVVADSIEKVRQNPPHDKEQKIP